MNKELIYPTAQYLSEGLGVRDSETTRLIYRLVDAVAKQIKVPWEVKKAVLSAINVSLREEQQENKKVLKELKESLLEKQDLDHYILARYLLPREFATESRACQVAYKNHELTDKRMESFLNSALQIGRHLTLEEKGRKKNYYVLYISWCEKMELSGKNSAILEEVKTIFQI